MSGDGGAAPPRANGGLGKAREDLFDARARRVIRRLAAGEFDASQARAFLRGLSVPDGPARLIKDGRWAVDGVYATGNEGARAAARAALEIDRG